MNLDLQSDYVWQNVKSLPSLFHAFWPEDMINYLHEHDIQTKIEDNGRILLKSWKARQLVEFLVDESAKNKTEFLLSHKVRNVERGTRDEEVFVVITDKVSFSAKKVIIATGWMTYPQIGASPFAYEMAEQLWLMLSKPHWALCWIETQEDFSSLAWNTVQATLTVFKDNKKVYTNKWSLLFTHRWISGPIVFDATLYIDQDISKYFLQCDFDLTVTSKKVIEKFILVDEDTVRDISITALRSIQEAKVSVWWILLKELDQIFQSKKIRWLYFIGESIDITGKTWWYNLQRAWTSAYVCAHSIQK